MSNVLAYNRGSHNVRSGFDLRKMATGRRAANDPRGRFDFTGDLTVWALRVRRMADFMLGLPRTVIPPTDQIQGHVGGWRNGFFINDVWQASRNLTLSLGLRYELNTPVQTYAGRGLDARLRLRDDHPERQPDRLPRSRDSSSTSRTTRTSRRASAPRIALARRPSCARATGSTTTRTR